MSAQIELIKGDMFEGSSDLVVIPCSTIPTITWFVAEHLRSFGIPEPHEPMEPGDISFVDLGRASNIAQVAAMAASVIAPGGSTLPTIERIGRKLGSYAVDNSWLSQISCPLLGTGAGELEPTEAARALTVGYSATAPERTLLRIFVLEDWTFERIRAVLLSELDRKIPEEVDNFAVADARCESSSAIRNLIVSTRIGLRPSQPILGEQEWMLA